MRLPLGFDGMVLGSLSARPHAWVWGDSNWINLAYCVSQSGAYNEGGSGTKIAANIPV